LKINLPIQIAMPYESVNGKYLVKWRRTYVKCTPTSMNMVYSHCAKQRTYVGGCAVAHFLFSNERVGAIFFSSAKKRKD
jgi:hypothetical protein